MVEEDGREMERFYLGEDWRTREGVFESRQAGEIVEGRKVVDR